MDEKQLFKLFRVYLSRNTQYEKNYREDMCTFLRKLPFSYIEKILSQWDVVEKTSDGKKLWKDSCNNKDYEICDEITPKVKTYYSKWKHHKFHSKRISGKEPYVDNYIDSVISLLKNGQLNKALTIIDIVYVLVDRAIVHKDKRDITNKSTTDERYLKGSKNALYLFRQFLETNKQFSEITESNDTQVMLFDDITKPTIHKIDGSMALAREIGVNNFIQYAIDQCYFFDPEDVKKQMFFIIKCFNNELFIHARKSTSQNVQKDDKLNPDEFNDLVKKQNETRNKIEICPLTVNKDTKHRLFFDTNSEISEYPVIIDTDGNEELRSVINSYNGYTVASGKESIFQNYKISHLWGRAFDPRFFTNLWNVVLVPAWANDLLDKPNPIKGSLESRLKSTLMKICEVLYFDEYDSSNWASLKMEQPSIINDGNDIVRPKNKEKYLINVILNKGNESVGNIKKHPVTI